MRAVSLSISVFFMRSWGQTIDYEGVTGGQKLKLCAALGFDIGSGLQAELDKKAAKAAAKAEKAAAKAAKKTPRGQTKLAVVVPETVIVLSDSEESDDEAAPARAAAGFHSRGKKHGFKAKDKYEDNKLRSVLAMRHLLNGMRESGTLDASLEPLLADHNVADAVLQGVWVLWQRAIPRMPARKRKRVSDA